MISRNTMQSFLMLPIQRIAPVVIGLMICGVPVVGQLQESLVTEKEKVFRVRHVAPEEVRRMLTDLLGSAAADADIKISDSRSEITVIGTESVQKVAEQLIQQIDQPQSESSAGGPPGSGLVLVTYASEPSQLEQNVRLLKSTLGQDARISADQSGRRIVVLASQAEQKTAARVLRSAGKSAGSGPSFGTNKSTRTTNPFQQPSDELRPGKNKVQSPREQNSRQDDSVPWLQMPEDDNAPGVAASQAERPVTARTEVNESQSVRYSFRHVTAEQAQKQLQRLLGRRLWELGRSRCNYQASGERTITLTFDSVSNSVLMEGPRDLARQFYTLSEHLDAASDRSEDQNIRFVPLTNVDPDTLHRALQLWKQSGAGQSSGEDSAPETESDSQGSAERSSPFRPASFLQQAGEPEIPITPEPSLPTDENGEQTDLRRPSSDVQVEPLPDLDVLILRGRDPDVEELRRIIQEIERLSSESAPEVEIIYLKNASGEAMDRLISRVLQDLTGPLQGRVSITPLVKPNALLLIGWGEAVEAAKKLIDRLDESVSPATQMQVFPLKHAPASQIENTVRQFLNGRGGLGPDVSITANQRTNTVIVNAAPRDMQEVARLIGRLDSDMSAAVSQARVIQLKNALATDVAQTISSTMNAGGGQRSAALEMLMLGPDGKSISARGLLNDVKLTPDARTNRIFITGPAESLPLVEELIRSLDESPAASAQIKVFQISNGDASDLVLLLRSLFPEQIPSTVPQLATAKDETSLAPVRFSVDIRTNSIIATGAAGDLQIIEALLLRLDETDSQQRVNEIYRLKNSRALDVANAVNNFLRSERIVAQAAPGRQNPFTQIESEVVIVPESTTNALIISATPRYFDQIIELVEGLDAQPPQVMIQVILVEIELDNLHEFGVELGLQDSLLFDRSLLGTLLEPGFNFNNRPLGNANTPNSLASRNNVGGQALSHFSLNRINPEADFGGLVLSASSENISVLLRALNQSRNIEILSRPEVTTLDNQPAFIQVGQKVPVITGTSINQIGQVNTVEQQDVGLILHVTPRISPDGMVVMEVSAEKSELGPEIEGVPISVSASGEVVRSPRTNITTAETTVSAASGQTIVIGGLITTNTTTVNRSVPWLSDVPILGNLFRYDATTNNRKELLIILTPRVIRGKSEADYLRQIEMARLSWISSDVLSWLSSDVCVTGELDSGDIPTIYPDTTPGVPFLEDGQTFNATPDTTPTPAEDTTLNDYSGFPEVPASPEVSTPKTAPDTTIRKLSFEKSADEQLSEVKKPRKSAATASSSIRKPARGTATRNNPSTK